MFLQFQAIDESSRSVIIGVRFTVRHFCDSRTLALVIEISLLWFVNFFKVEGICFVI